MIGNEDGVGTDGGHHHGLERDRSPAGLGDGPIAIVNAEFFGKARVNLDARLGILIDQRADASRLGSGKKLADDAAGGEEDGVFVADVVNGRAIIGDVEARLAIGEVKRASAFGDGVVAAGLKEPGRARMIGRWLTGLVIVRRAGPEDAELFFNFFVVLIIVTFNETV